MTVADAIRAATTRLSATSDTARLDAELLMAHALGVSRSDMLLVHANSASPPGFGPLVDRRALHEPIAYITGEQEFYGLELAVAPGVLIPRSDSETLIEAAREAFADLPPPKRIADLGTGSGALLLAALSLFPGAAGHGIDVSVDAQSFFARNAEQHGQGRSIDFSLANWRNPGWADRLGTFDLVLCNPPYVETDATLAPDVSEYEPHGALFAGIDGLDDYRILLPQLRQLMNKAGIAILEIGHAQSKPVAMLAESCGFSVKVKNDLANRPRCVVLW